MFYFLLLHPLLLAAIEVQALDAPKGGLKGLLIRCSVVPT